MSDDVQSPPAGATPSLGAAASAGGSGAVRILRAAVRALAPQDFIERYAQFVGDDWLLLPWAEGLARGTVGRFVILLAGGSPVMRGRLQVLEVIEPRGGGVREIRARLLELDDASNELHGQLVRHGRKKRAGKGTDALHLGRTLPPPLPGGPEPPSVVSPVHSGSLSELFVNCVYEEDAITPSVNRPGDILDAGPLPHLTPPVATMIRPTGRFPGKSRSLVARRSRVPRFLYPVAEIAAQAWAAVLAILPGAQRKRVVHGLAVISLAAASFMLGRCTKSGTELPGGGLKTEAGAGGHEFEKHHVQEGSMERMPAAPGAVSAIEAPVEETSGAHGPARCSATIETQPEGAEVSWGEAVLGKTPILGTDVPCGRSLVAIVHPRFEPRLLNVTAMVGRKLHLSETLRRPEAVVLLDTAPSGAVISVGAHKVGTTPGRLEVSRFEEIELTFTKDGYRPVTRTLKVEKAEEVVTVTLRAEPKRDVTLRSRRRALR